MSRIIKCLLKYITILEKIHTKLIKYYKLIILSSKIHSFNLNNVIKGIFSIGYFLEYFFIFLCITIVTNKAIVLCMHI